MSYVISALNRKKTVVRTRNVWPIKGRTGSLYRHASAQLMTASTNIAPARNEANDSSSHAAATAPDVLGKSHRSASTAANAAYAALGGVE